MATTGAVNGTDAGLAIETTPGGGTYADIGGITTNSMTWNDAAIIITNKSSDGWQEILDQKGARNVELTLECVFNSDANFALMEATLTSQSILNYQYARGGKTFTGGFKMTSWAETSPDSDKLTASVTLTSSGEVVIA